MPTATLFLIAIIAAIASCLSASSSHGGASVQLFEWSDIKLYFSHIP